MRNSALFGGTFDPPHRGHLHIFHQVASLTDIDSLIVVPARISNFKQGTHPVDFDSRFRMTELLIQDYRAMYPDDDLDIQLSDYEGRKSGVSYSADTVRHFFDDISRDGRVSFVIGDDHLASLERWHDWEYLRSHVRFICFTRENAPCDIDADIEYIRSPALKASSSEIRSGSRDMLTPSVRRYIDANKLYRTESQG